MPQAFTGKFTQTFLDNPGDGTHTDGSGLYLAVRKGGKARSWSFRRGGKRRTIGSAFRISLKDAQARVREFCDQLDAGEDPFEASPEEDKGETFREAVAAHYLHKCQSEWRDDAQALGRSMIRSYVDYRFMIEDGDKISGWVAPCADKALKDIDVKDIARIFKRPTSSDDSRRVWVGKPVISRRAALMLKEMFDIAIAEDRYPGPKNPADTKKNTPLRTILGPQPTGGHRIGLPPESVPKLMAHLRTPLYAHEADECTTAEAAEAIGCDTEAILKANRRGLLPSAYKLPGKAHNTGSWVFKIAELERTFRFRQPPRRHAEIPLHARVLQFIILTLARSDMACGLRWDEVNEKRGIIDFGERHKMAERDPEADYTVPLTDNLLELLEAMRVEQKHNGQSDLDLVFVHGPTRVGLNRLSDNPPHVNHINTHYQRQLVRLGLTNSETDGNRKPCVHGFRNTFPEWACEWNNYPRDHVDAQLGHKQPGNNSMYFRNVKYLNHRRKILKAWEEHCLSWVGAPSDNVIPLRTAMGGK